MDLFTSGKCEIMTKNEIIHNALSHITPIICVKKNINRLITFLGENCINGTERVNFYFNDIQYIALNNNLYNITHNDNNYYLTSENDKNTITINTESTIHYIRSKEKQENAFEILSLNFNINDDNYVLFNILNEQDINNLYDNNIQFNIIITLDELYKDYLKSNVFKNINKLSVFYKNIQKLLNDEKIPSIWHSVKTPFNLCFGFTNAELNHQHCMDFNIFLPPSDKFIKLSDKKIDQYCECIKN